MKSLPPLALLAHSFLLSSMVLSACNDGGAGTAPATRSSAAMLVATTVEASGANCAAGGVKISSGADTNGNGILETSEVTNVQYACNGTAGTSGAGSIVKTAALAVGDAHCPAGGDAVEVGVDTNGNGVLDASEISSTAYVCQGATGSTGAAGAIGSHGITGTNSVINIVALAAGATCQYGGYTITAGPDDGSGQIAAVTSTAHICNGVPGADVNWVDVAGTSQQAQSNTGYLADNAARVTITLPASPAIGDLVRISGAGAGGWTIAQNAGQTVRTQSIPTGSTDWTSQTGGGWHTWTSIASSSDGSHLAATANYDGIYTSVDAGVTWTRQPGAGQRSWGAIASSDDGRHLAATDRNFGYVYTSADSGVTWVARTLSGQRVWSSIASSANGSLLAAADRTPGYIYTSADFGANWQQSASGQHNWSAISSSTDGSKLAAADANNGYINTSTDGGMTWTPQAGSGQGAWSAVASSSDGVHLAAAGTFDYIYTSADSGVTWTKRSGSGSRVWSSIASSADGTALGAVENNGYIYTSRNSGVSWTQNLSSGSRTWISIASSSDGSHLAAIEAYGFVSTESGRSETTVGTGGSLGGLQYDMIELQYFGSGVFGVMSYTSDSGSFTVQ